jgi:rod shape determining protein RodA
MILLPVALVVIEPYLGTGALIAAGGVLVIVMAGLPVRVIMTLSAAAAGAAYFGWNFMKDYQRARILTFLDPTSDPQGAGYHIIQSTIGIGSGGFMGKGWMQGTQAQLDFLPERSTDFIFAVIGEEFGLRGLSLLLLLYLGVVGRALYLAMQTQDTFARLLSGSLALTFFVYVFINAGMVTGIVPVVGVPLPLVSYGGSSVVTLLAGFGILMALYSHRKLIGS